MVYRLKFLIKKQFKRYSKKVLFFIFKTKNHFRYKKITAIIFSFEIVISFLPLENTSGGCDISVTDQKNTDST
jgi:hypothetical protein